MRLSNKDKQNIRQLLFSQIENTLLAIGDSYSGWFDDFKNVDHGDVANYMYKIIGLYPKSDHDG